MQQDPASTMRVFRPAPNVFAFYDGRGDQPRWSEAPNWLDDGALALGTCSYAVVDGAEALVYDSHCSIGHATTIRRMLTEQGVRSIRLLLSHWHVDHVAGNVVFADCEILSSRLTADSLVSHQDELQGRAPAISPLVHPTTIFEGRQRLQVGGIAVELTPMDIHSQDGIVLLLPEEGLLLAGDTLEDPITYVTEPDRLARHLVDLDRMAGQDIARILPNHGDPAVIASGGFGPALIAATRRYVQVLLAIARGERPPGQDLRAIIADDLAAGHLRYWAPYEEVHRRNVGQVLDVARQQAMSAG